jgi:putative ABC transport system substrate-binding protein
VVPQVQDVERSAAMLSIEHRTFLMRTSEDLQRGLQSAVDWKADAIVRLAGQGFVLGPETGRLATERRIPSMLMQKRDVEAGGLMSYFADHRELWRRVAAYVDRLLKGTSPRELPFELPSRFELVINLVTAKSLGLVLPSSLVARADDVIE